MNLQQLKDQSFNTQVMVIKTFLDEAKNDIKNEINQLKDQVSESNKSIDDIKVQITNINKLVKENGAKSDEAKSDEVTSKEKEKSIFEQIDLLKTSNTELKEQIVRIYGKLFPNDGGKFPDVSGNKERVHFSMKNNKLVAEIDQDEVNHDKSMIQPPKDYDIPEKNIPDDDIPDNGIPDNGIPDDGIPDNGIPDDDIPDNGIPDDDIHDNDIPDDQNSQKLIEDESFINEVKKVSREVFEKQTEHNQENIDLNSEAFSNKVKAIFNEAFGTQTTQNQKNIDLNSEAFVNKVKEIVNKTFGTQTTQNQENIDTNSEAFVNKVKEIVNEALESQTTQNQENIDINSEDFAKKVKELNLLQLSQLKVVSEFCLQRNKKLTMKTNFEGDTPGKQTRKGKKQ